MATGSAHKKIKINIKNPIVLVIPGGGQISDVRLQPNFLHFHAVFKKILPNNRLAPHPLSEVLDSIEKKIYVVKFGPIILSFRLWSTKDGYKSLISKYLAYL